MAKKLQLGLAAYSEIGVMGLVSQMPDYRLVHFLNKETNLHLVKYPDLPVPTDMPGITGYFPFFTAQLEEYGMTCFLVANRCPDHPAIFPVLKQIDYFLILMDLNDRFSITDMMKTFRTIAGVQMVQEIKPGIIPRVEEILGLMELHIQSVHDKRKKL